MPDARTDPARISFVLAQLEATWRANPSQRLCQLLVNAANTNDPFYVEDIVIVRELAEYLRMGRPT